MSVISQAAVAAAAAADWEQHATACCSKRVNTPVRGLTRSRVQPAATKFSLMIWQLRELRELELLQASLWLLEFTKAAIADFNPKICHFFVCLSLAVLSLIYMHFSTSETCWNFYYKKARNEWKSVAWHFWEWYFSLFIFAFRVSPSPHLHKQSCQFLDQIKQSSTYFCAKINTTAKSGKK